MLTVKYYYFFLVYMVDGNVMVTYIPNKVNNFVFLYDWRESYLLIGPICLNKLSLCLPGNWSKPVHKLILHENQLELVSRS